MREMTPITSAHRETMILLGCYLLPFILVQPASGFTSLLGGACKLHPFAPPPCSSVHRRHQTLFMTVDNDSEESVLDELSSPELMFGMATRSGEGATAMSHLAANLNETVAELRTAASNLTAMSEPKEKEQEDHIEAPSVKKILKFAIPAIGVWLCGPLLSLIDTSAVGLLSGTAQQAALNPAVAVTEYTALLIVSFLCLPTLFNRL
jgi:hypothetical protein